MKNLWFYRFNSLIFIMIMLILLITGCASLSLKKFEQLELGISKSDVLEKLGSPFQSQHRDEVDYWMYRFYQDGSWVTREVQFKKGQVIYIGQVMTDLEREQYHYKSPIDNQQELEKELKNTNEKPSATFEPVL